MVYCYLIFVTLSPHPSAQRPEVNMSRVRSLKSLYQFTDFLINVSCLHNVLNEVLNLCLRFWIILDAETQMRVLIHADFIFLD